MAKKGQTTKSKPPIKQKYIETPQKMWELFCEFRTQKKATPIKVVDYVGKDGNKVYREHERPLTLEGFSTWLFETGVTGNVYDYFGNKGGAYETYSEICRIIKDLIRTDQIEGGMANVYNPSITQRLNGLKEQVEQSGSVKILNIDPID